MTGVNIEPFFSSPCVPSPEHLFDGLGEDLSADRAVLTSPRLELAIEVEKTVGDVCPGENTTVNVTVTNTSDRDPGSGGSGRHHSRRLQLCGRKQLHCRARNRGSGAVLGRRPHGRPATS